MVIVLKAYDDISWTSFSRDLSLPIFASSILAGLILCLYCRLRHQTAAHNGDQYSSISLQEIDANSNRIESVDSDAESATDIGTTSMENTPCEKTPNEESAADSLSPTTPNHSCSRGKWIDSFPILGLVLLYFYDSNVIMALIGMAVLLMLWGLTFGQNGSELLLLEDAYSLVANLDYGILLWYTSLMVLVSGWTDTGVPMYIVESVLGSCSERLMQGWWCTTATSSLFSLISAVASPVASVLIFGDTFPYASPYCWMQLALAVSMGGSLSPLGAAAAAKFGLSSREPQDRVPVLLSRALCCYLALLVGTTLLQYFHWSYECSVRLGECS
ncbi:oculocutaneous albinism II [Seminavis robusta]|uniref:Oculocutaneous albinism II n=1 Tax=Seminavis robusta TaxID=568900 RepID=A0A9N8HZX0_9STRA|nr:oculocutaneous albinism II [Seminavis robusta]|eukprot:Sro2408_g326650.1 oculocutaneous albinism II (330) ;mRNA; r:12847-13836